MRAEWINPFLKAALSVFHSFGFEVERGDLRLCHSPMSGHEVNVAIGVAGDLQGQVIVGMETDTALDVARAMIPWGVSEFDEVARSSIAELTNMLCGNAVSHASELGISAHLSVPSLFLGKEVEISTGGLPSLVIPLRLRTATGKGTGEVDMTVLLLE
ncbi:MAG: chemotaxis protein CheX [Bacillota bacterium]|nr:chemotaxis protein CheX [Bacillota bacterium]